jgi:hypothetical protein
VRLAGGGRQASPRFSVAAAAAAATAFPIQTRAALLSHENGPAGRLGGRIGVAVVSRNSAAEQLGKERRQPACMQSRLAPQVNYFMAGCECACVPACVRMQRTVV